MLKNKGQISIEVLIILSMLVIGGVIFGVYYINHLNSTITDSDNVENIDDITETFVNSVDRFSVEISNPQEGQTYSPGSITFTAGYSNTNGATVDCNWSKGSTQIITHNCSDSNTLSEGTYVITVTAKAGEQTATDSVRIHVE